MVASRSGLSQPFSFRSSLMMHADYNWYKMLCQRMRKCTPQDQTLTTHTITHSSLTSYVKTTCYSAYSGSSTTWFITSHNITSSIIKQYNFASHTVLNNARGKFIVILHKLVVVLYHKRLYENSSHSITSHLKDIEYEEIIIVLHNQVLVFQLPLTYTNVISSKVLRLLCFTAHIHVHGIYTCSNCAFESMNRGIFFLCLCT